MQTKNNSHEKTRLDEVNRAIAGQPEYVMERHREPILRGEVVLGMTPFEAKLAGGAYAYQVKPDETVWPKKCDPLKVMWSQSIRPDNSYIRMIFKNTTQFPTEGMSTFTVIFKNGKAAELTEGEK